MALLGQQKAAEEMRASKKIHSESLVGLDQNSFFGALNKKDSTPKQTPFDSIDKKKSDTTGASGKDTQKVPLLGTVSQKVPLPGKSSFKFGNVVDQVKARQVTSEGDDLGKDPLGGSKKANTATGKPHLLDAYWSAIRDETRRTIAEKRSERREYDLGHKMERGYLKYKFLINILAIPLWSSFLLIFLSFYGGDIVNIIYFGLTPIDTLMDGVISREFLSATNGIMINTHRKIFKYRSAIA